MNSYVARAVEDYLDARFDSEDILAALQRRGRVDPGYVIVKPKPKPTRPQRNDS